jgi:hypothetical protein
MGKGQRAKGAQGERELAGRLTELLGNQTVQRELSQTRDGGCDLVLRSTAGDVNVEVKRVERRSPDIYGWLGQCEASCQNGELAVVAWRPNRRGWTITLSLEDFATLLREAQPDEPWTDGEASAWALQNCS